jgi:hypothetical protein
MSSQYVAAASQNFTSPGVTGVDPASTVAVSVTTAPDATVVTTLVPDVIASVVVVAVCATALIEKAAIENANTMNCLRMIPPRFAVGFRIRGPN